jgi:CheY-like chemotaxis protein
LRILHLEDNALDGELIAWTLQSAGIPCLITRVECEADFAAAIRQGEIDLILSDSSVPGFSGLTALEMARAANLPVPFVFLTGHAAQERRDKAVRLGATDYLSKDHRAQLLFLVQGLCQRKSRD